MRIFDLNVTPNFDRKFSNDLLINNNMKSDAPMVISCLNPHSYVVSKSDLEFKNALAESDFLLPDGIGIVIAGLLLNGRLIPRFSGLDAFMHVMEIGNYRRLKVFFLGSSEVVLSMIHDQVKKDFPMIEFHCFSPPFTSSFSRSENSLILDKIREIDPDILCVGMTAPRQEKWVYCNRAFISARVVMNIGAVFDFYSGNKRTAPGFVQSIGLEWLFRLLNEPKRLWRRTLISGPIFIFYMLKALLGFNSNRR